MSKIKIDRSNFKSIIIGDIIEISGMSWVVTSKDHDAIVGDFYILSRSGYIPVTMLFDLIELDLSGDVYKIGNGIVSSVNKKEEKNALKDECSKCYFKGMDLIHVPGCNRYVAVEVNQPWAIISKK